jgi:hypothetical protein
LLGSLDGELAELVLGLELLELVLGEDVSEPVLDDPKVLLDVAPLKPPYVVS